MSPALNIVDGVIENHAPIPEGSGQISYPRPATTVHQIEVTSKCNLRCVYCPSPKLEKMRGQPPQFISDEHFDRALEHAVHFDEKGTQGELALTGIGEALLHPKFIDHVRRAREALPFARLTFSTNGLLLTEEYVEALVPYQPEIYISLHRPEKAGPAIQAARKHGLLAAVNNSAATLAFDWAGQVDWFVSAKSGEENPCAFLGLGWCVVLADGRVTTCCLDASGAGVVGHVNDDLGSFSLAPFSLCGTCHHSVP